VRALNPVSSIHVDGGFVEYLESIPYFRTEVNRVAGAAFSLFYFDNSGYLQAIREKTQVFPEERLKS
jgi:hypothetical protein